MEKSKAPNLNLHISFLEGSFWVSVLVFNGFYTTFLRDFGYGDAFVSIALMAIGLACLVLQPLFGYLADRFCKSKQMLLACLGVFAISLPLLFRFHENRVFVIVFSVFMVGAAQSSIGVLDSWVAKLQKQRKGINYGKVRSVGSLTYAVGAVVFGQALTQFGNGFAIIFMAVTFAVIAVSVIKIPNPAKEPAEHGAVKVSSREAMKTLFSNKQFLFFLLCMLVTGLSNQSFFTFYALLVRTLGGTQTHVGIGYFILAISEIAVMANYNKLKNHFGTVTLLGIGMAGYFVKMFTISLSGSVGFALFSVVTQAVSFAIVVPGAIAYMSEKVETRYLATATLLNQSMNSLSSIIGNPIYGPLAEATSINMVMRISSVLALVGGGAFLLYNRREVKAESALRRQRRLHLQ